MGRCVYEGIYDPKSPLADEQGLRTDVMDALRDQKYTAIRYPGGNFLSGYNWLDGVGPKEKRPRRRETGLAVDRDQPVRHQRVYRVLPQDRRQADAGRQHGHRHARRPPATWSSTATPPSAPTTPTCAPHTATVTRTTYPCWCVGNEMDGPWQIGALGAAEYGAKALEAAKIMKWQDPTIKTVLCGSSNDRMPTYPQWDRIALEYAYEYVDYLSIHYYAGNRENDTASYLANALLFEEYVDTLAATARYVKAKRRSKHDVYLSWDEWQVWYKGDPTQGGWTEAPHLAEEQYNLEDALVVGQWLNVFLRKSDVLKIACVAQIVNVISWMHTKSDGLLKFPSYDVFKLFSNNASGHALDVLVKAPQVETKQFDFVPALDVSASYDEATGNGRNLYRQPQPDRRRRHGRGVAERQPRLCRRGMAAGRHRRQGSQHVG